MSTDLKEIVDACNSETSLSEASTPASSWYTDPRILELEQNTVLSQSWMLVARATQLCKPGHYITCEIGSEPILVVRSSDDILRGFFTVCRDHAAAVVAQCE